MAHLTDGSGSLSWPTMAMGTHERGAYAHKGVCEALRKGKKPKVQELLVDRVVVESEVNWPTPQQSEYKGMSQRGLHSPKDRLSNAVGLLGQDSLNTNGKSQELWPTPRAQFSEKPTSNGYGDTLIEKIQGHKRYITKKLNPNWVEQLMGLPLGWTDCDF